MRTRKESGDGDGMPTTDIQLERLGHGTQCMAEQAGTDLAGMVHSQQHLGLGAWCEDGEQRWVITVQHNRCAGAFWSMVSGLKLVAGVW